MFYLGHSFPFHLITLLLYFEIGVKIKFTQICNYPLNISYTIGSTHQLTPNEIQVLHITNFYHLLFINLLEMLSKNKSLWILMWKVKLQECCFYTLPDKPQFADFTRGFFSNIQKLNRFAGLLVLSVRLTSFWSNTECSHAFKYITGMRYTLITKCLILIHTLSFFKYPPSLELKGSQKVKWVFK